MVGLPQIYLGSGADQTLDSYNEDYQPLILVISVSLDYYNKWQCYCKCFMRKFYMLVQLKNPSDLHTPVHLYRMICTKFQPLIANQNEQISFSKHNEEFRVMNHECMSIHGLL